jgi:gas vesicle protein
MTMANEDNGLNAGTVILAFLGGAAVGAGLALLYAPKTGKELRTNIKTLTDDAVCKIKDYAAEAQDKIKTTIEESKDLFNEKKSILSSAIEAGREAMGKEKERTKDA